MKNTFLAHRYAKALFELAIEKQSIETTLVEFREFLSMVKTDPNLDSIFNLPSAVQREHILSDILRKQFSELFVNFLFVVVRNRRYLLLAQIYHALQSLIDVHFHQFRIQVVTAVPLSDKRVFDISEQMSAFLKANVIIEKIVDPSIIGGIIIRLDGHIFNGSIVEKFKKLKEHILTNPK